MRCIGTDGVAAGALKLAHEFALHLDELYQVLISDVVKVAGVADFFLLGANADRNLLRAVDWIAGGQE